MSGPQQVVAAELRKQQGVLVGVVPKTNRPKDQKPKELGRSEWDDGLAVHVATMAEGDTVQVEVVFDSEGRRTARLVGVAPLMAIEPDRERGSAVEAGGFVNPYTFVPTLPRADRQGTRLEGTDLDDAPPPSHAHHADGQWSGTVALTLTTVTPLLLPVPAAEQPEGGPRTFDVRVGPDGRPLIHGASLKGALRSAYETVTASRYGVFFEHDVPLAYRATASAALELTPARVHRDDDGTAYFRLCKGDTEGVSTSRHGAKIQYEVLVPAYGTRPVQRLGDLAAKQLSDHHGTQVYARIVPSGRGGHGGDNSPSWRATHLARTQAEIEAHLRTSAARADQPGAHDSGGRHRIVRGWLSATGYSIASKHNERLFVESPGLDVPVTEEHLRYWRSVLRAYDLAYGYNDPQATYRRIPAGADGIERSRHVPSTPELRGLPHGTLVYVKYDERRKEVTEVHPVMIGRLPFEAVPGELLHESLRPAHHRDQLSPADRLFGWVPPGRPDDGSDTNDGASGYRGRLRVRSITCTTGDWRPPSFPPEGVTLAPLSSPKPTQFRFYASSDRTTGMPMERGAAKAEGYANDGGLRGRKMYRWRDEEPEHWQPTRGTDDPTRGYLALADHDRNRKQLVRHRSWVRPGVTFQVELFLDGVPEAELGALLWLLRRGDEAPLRLGAGKPYGFGVITAQLDLDRTRLWDHTGVRAGWLRLDRPDPASQQRLTELVDEFTAAARGNEVLREATESYLAAARPVDHPVHYPRTTREPQAESYQWFVANERVVGGETVEGWSLPHVRDSEQRLPYLGGGSHAPGRAGRDQEAPQGRQTQASGPVPQQQRRSGPKRNRSRRGQ